MKSKIISLFIFLFLFSFTAYVTADTNNPVEKSEPNPVSEFIDYFDWGIITGTYEIEKYNNKGQLVLKNEDWSKTMRVTGVGWYYVGDMPYKTFGSVKTGMVTIEKFYGLHNNGHVFGLGVKYIDYAR